MNKKLILTSFAIFISLIFLMAPIGAASHSISPATTSTNYQPNPSLNTQATWTSFNSSMAYNEYINSTGGASYLNIQNGTGNYIGLIPQDIQSKDLQGDTIGKYGYWNQTATVNTPGTTNVSFTAYKTTVNGQQAIVTEADKTGSGAYAGGAQITIPTTDYVSTNPAYDYITVIISSNITASSGTNSFLQIYNGTTSKELTPTITTGSSYISISLEQIMKETGIGLNTTAGQGYSSELKIQDIVNVASGAPDGQYYAQIDGMAFTTYPLVLGYNATGRAVVQANNEAYMNVFKPAVPITVINAGYTENISQPLSMTNYTTTQTAITSGSYIEQVGYQATFSLPSSPDLSYSASNFTLPLSVPASQFQVLDVNGVSYLSSLGNKTNGTAVLLSSVNPTTPITYLAYVDYTASQWQSISHPAGIFTIAGIEYYWFIAVGAIAGLLGLAGGVRHAHNKAEQTEKVKGIGPRGRA